MKTRILGRTNLVVGEIGLGGEWLNGLSSQETTAIIDTALAEGMNLIDIFMPQGDTRSNIGIALKGRREKFVLQGHLCTVFEDGQYERTRDIAKTKASFTDLLERLQTDYIDIGMIHYVDSLADYASVFDTEIIAYAKELKEKGIIKHIGMSSHNPHVALKAVETGLIDVLMFSINPAYDLEQGDTDIMDLIEFKDLKENDWVVDPARQKLYTTCEALGVAITVMKPLGAGSLLSAEASPFGIALTVPQCIAYALSRQGVKVAIIGCHTPEEVLSAAAYRNTPQAQRDYSHIFATTKEIKMTGRCMYCNHCQPCPAHIDIAGVTKFLDLALQQEAVPETVKSHYHAMKTTAADCLMCGNCEPNCPFGVNIRENMKKAMEVFSQ